MCWLFRDARRGTLRAAALPLACAAGIAHGACGEALKKPRVLQGARHQIAYATSPAPIPRDRHFALEVVVCPAGGQPTPDSLVVDARMPAHGHGMAYQPRTQRMGTGHWRVDGMLLHMAGSWTLSFEVGTGAQAERISEELLLK